MNIDISQFHQTFFEESIEGLDLMESGLLGLDIGATDDEIVNAIFRAAHSIKGGAATFGFKEIAEFTHVMETLLDEVRDGRRDVSRELIDVFLASVDCLKDMLAAAQSHSDYDNATISRLQGILNSFLGNDIGTSSDAADTDSGKSSTEITSGSWRIIFKPHVHMLGTGNEPLRLFRDLEELGNLSIKADTAKIPSLADMDPEDCYLAWELTLESDVAKERITEIFEWVEDDCELSIMPLQLQCEQTSQATANIEDNTAKANLAETNKKAIAPESSSIRVSIDKVDALINMVGELVITQSMISQFNCDVEDFDASHIEKLKAGLTLLERNTRELQESVMRIRMLPISFAFNRFPRMVRDMSQKLGKEIVLKMTGEQTELDKTVMEKIGDPLVHLVRNSLDHGIEKPDERVAAGKSATGTIELNAYHKGGNIIIEVTDDGAGLNKEKILNKARDRGLVDGDNLTDDNIYDLIFQPGFSTAETVSDVSGRGVGMDVVKRNIRELGGSVDVTSVDGKGSKFTVRLPLTLAILDGQLVRVGNEVYIMPLVSIVESIQIQKENINSIVGKSEVYNIRDEYIPIVRMHDVFTVKSVSQEQQDNLLVIVEGDGHKVGLVVDDLLGQQQVVIKSLETNYQRLKGISGGTILGDGTVALILDVEGIIALSKEGPLSGNKLNPLQSESLAVA